MKHSTLLALAAAFSMVVASPALAVSTAFLKSSGAGSACTLAAPCAVMSSAITAAGDGGEVVCLDKYRYGAILTIVASVTISCGDGLWDNSLTGLIISTPANSRVVIEGLVGDCLGLNCGPIIVFSGQGSLELRHVSIGHSGGSSAHGLQFKPNGPASLTVSDSYFYDVPLAGILVQPTSGTSFVSIRNSSFTGNGQNGISISPTGSGNATVTLDNVRSSFNAGGVLALAGAGSNIELQVRNSVLSENSNFGLVSQTSGGVSVAFVDHSSFSQNASIGLYASGANAYLLVNASTIERNNVGWAFASGGQLLSYSNNVALNVSSFGGPSGVIGLQ